MRCVMDSNPSHSRLFIMTPLFLPAPSRFTVHRSAYHITLLVHNTSYFYKLFLPILHNFIQNRIFWISLSVKYFP